MLVDTMTPTQAGLMVLAVTLAPAALVLTASALSNVWLAFWLGRQADSDERARRIQP